MENTKIKKSGDSLNIELVTNPDIVEWASTNKEEKQITVGFALETNNEKENALLKLSRKKMDVIILNSLNEKGAGFETDTNKISIFDSKGRHQEFSLKQKSEVARDIFKYINDYNQ